MPTVIAGQTIAAGFFNLKPDLHRVADLTALGNLNPSPALENTLSYAYVTGFGAYRYDSASVAPVNSPNVIAAFPGGRWIRDLGGDHVFGGAVGSTLGGRLMATENSPARYLSNNPNRVQNPSGELALTGWTVVTGTPATFDEAEGGWCFRATAAFEMFTDVKVWRANKDEYVSVLPAFQSEGTEIQVELLDAAKVLLATLTPWVNITTAGIVLGYASAAGWVATNADGFLRVRFRSIAVPLTDTRFRGVSVAYGLPVIGGGYPVHLLRYLYDRPSGGGTFQKPRPHEASLAGATSGETITLPASDADTVPYAGKADFVEYASSSSQVLETLAGSQWSYNDGTRVLTYNGQTLAGARTVVHMRGRVV